MVKNSTLKTDGAGVAESSDQQSWARLAAAVSRHVHEVRRAGLAGPVLESAVQLERQLGLELQLRAARFDVRDDPVVAAVEAWMRESADERDRVKVLCGVRGSWKSVLFSRFRTRLLEEGTDPDEVVYVNFETMHFRRLKTSADVLRFLSVYRTDRVRHLFLDGVTRLNEFSRLFPALLASGRWNVWMTTSNRKCVEMVADHALVHHTFPPRLGARDPATLERLWNTMFLLDVPFGQRHIDLRSHAALIEYLSDHMGEELTARGISRDLQAHGVTISPNSVKSYVAALDDAYMLLVLECWDLFEDCVVGPALKIFASDLEMRAHRFGAYPPAEAWRDRLSELALRLAREYPRVYFTREPGVDFVTFDAAGHLRRWSVE